MNKRYVLMSALAILSVSACQKETGSQNGIKSKNTINFTVTDKEVVESKAGETAFHKSVILYSEDKQDSLRMTMSARPTRFDEYEITGTKGVPVTTDNLVEQYDGNIGIAAYEKKGSTYEQYIPVSVLKHNSDNAWEIMDGDKQKSYMWPSSDIQFWAWAPKDVINPSINGTTASFEYSMPEPGADGKDAEKMKDILFTSALANANTDNDNVSLHLEHALAVLKFEIGKTNDCTVKSITLKNVYSKATFTYSYGVGTTISWSNLNTPETYFQSIGKTVHEHLVDDENVQPVGTSAETFMVIPQTSNSDNTIELEVVYCLAGSTEDITLSKELDKELTGWQAGYSYTYTLSIVNGLDLEIDDEVTGNVKSNLQISNNGGRDAYVRALITGYWVNSDGDIVANWSPSDAAMGLFSPAIFSGTLNENWVKGADGFFYYTKILPAAASTVTRLFDSYTVNDNGKPKYLKATDRLEIDIVSQAVLADKDKTAITTAWGATAAGYVE